MQMAMVAPRTRKPHITQMLHLYLSQGQFPCSGPGVGTPQPGMAQPGAQAGMAQTQMGTPPVASSAGGPSGVSSVGPMGPQSVGSGGPNSAVGAPASSMTPPNSSQQLPRTPVSFPTDSQAHTPASLMTAMASIKFGDRKPEVKKEVKEEDDSSDSASSQAPVKKIFKPEELRQALMPTLKSLYRQDPESLPFRMPVDPQLLCIPVPLLQEVFHRDPGRDGFLGRRPHPAADIDKQGTI
ncbi:CREB-binding protein-like [Pseudoliparis swirei]|uniref:CREB-binding protein-like n=1 Tax=Pseudoliparis swirei TaxID=2059687 RepID=UPI0024BE79CD|nr:CREB-binding protein-like [Pseudoliparis swirei]